MFLTIRTLPHVGRSVPAPTSFAFDEPTWKEQSSDPMHALKAQMKNGRLVLDEPTDLPEGEVVYLQRVDGIVSAADGNMSSGERAALHQELEESLAEADAGETEDFRKVISELRSRL